VPDRSLPHWLPSFQTVPLGRFAVVVSLLLFLARTTSALGATPACPDTPYVQMVVSAAQSSFPENLLCAPDGVRNNQRTDGNVTHVNLPDGEIVVDFGPSTPIVGGPGWDLLFYEWKHLENYILLDWIVIEVAPDKAGVPGEYRKVFVWGDAVGERTTRNEAGDELINNGSLNGFFDQELPETRVEAAQLIAGANGYLAIGIEVSENPDDVFRFVRLRPLPGADPARYSDEDDLRPEIDALERVYSRIPLPPTPTSTGLPSPTPPDSATLTPTGEVATSVPTATDAAYPPPTIISTVPSTPTPEPASATPSITPTLTLAPTVTPTFTLAPTVTLGITPSATPPPPSSTPSAPSPQPTTAPTTTAPPQPTAVPATVAQPTSANPAPSSTALPGVAASPEPTVGTTTLPSPELSPTPLAATSTAPPEPTATTAVSASATPAPGTTPEQTIVPTPEPSGVATPSTPLPTPGQTAATSTATSAMSTAQPVTVSFEQAAFGAKREQAGARLEWRLVLSAPATALMTVTYKVDLAMSSAQHGLDFLGVTETVTIYIQKGDTDYLLIDRYIIESDELEEEEETVQLNLLTVEGGIPAGVLGKPDVAIASIEDDDTKVWQNLLVQFWLSVLSNTLAGILLARWLYQAIQALWQKLRSTAQQGGATPKAAGGGSVVMVLSLNVNGSNERVLRRALQERGFQRKPIERIMQHRFREGKTFKNAHDFKQRLTKEWNLLQGWEYDKLIDPASRRPLGPRQGR